MIALVFVLAAIFFAISAKIIVSISKGRRFAFCGEESTAFSLPRFKTGVIALLMWYLIKIIKYIIITIKNFTGDHFYQQQVGAIFESVISSTFNFLAYSVCVLTIVFMLKNSQRKALISLFAMLILTLCGYIYIGSVGLTGAYLDLLPNILVILAVIVLILSSNGNHELYLQYRKLIKVVPYTILLTLISPIILGLKDFKAFLSVDFWSQLLLTAIKFVAYYLIITTLIAFVEEKIPFATEVRPLNKTKKILIAAAIVVLPATVYLLSSIPKIWLFIASLILPIAISVSYAVTENSSELVRILAITISIVFVISLCLCVKFFGSTSEQSCGHPGCAEEGPFHCMGKNNTCPNYTYCAYDLYCDECD